MQEIDITKLIQAAPYTDNEKKTILNFWKEFNILFGEDIDQEKLFEKIIRNYKTSNTKEEKKTSSQDEQVYNDLMTSEYKSIVFSNFLRTITNIDNPCTTGIYEGIIQWILKKKNSKFSIASKNSKTHVIRDITEKIIYSVGQNKILKAFLQQESSLASLIPLNILDDVNIIYSSEKANNDENDEKRSLKVTKAFSDIALYLDDKRQIKNIEDFKSEIKEFKSTMLLDGNNKSYEIFERIDRRAKEIKKNGYDDSNIESVLSYYNMSKPYELYKAVSALTKYRIPKNDLVKFLPDLENLLKPEYSSYTSKLINKLRESSLESKMSNSEYLRIFMHTVSKQIRETPDIDIDTLSIYEMIPYKEYTDGKLVVLKDDNKMLSVYREENGEYKRLDSYSRLGEKDGEYSIRTNIRDERAHIVVDDSSVEGIYRDGENVTEYYKMIIQPSNYDILQKREEALENRKVYLQRSFPNNLTGVLKGIDSNIEKIESKIKRIQFRREQRNEKLKNTLLERPEEQKKTGKLDKQQGNEKDI